MGGAQEGWCCECLDAAGAVQALEVDYAGWESFDGEEPDFETELDGEVREEVKRGKSWHFYCWSGNGKWNGGVVEAGCST